jgi:CBS domain-containing protein
VKVEEIMNRKVLTVRSDESVAKVAALICLNNISGVPVVNEENRLVGIVSEKDILRAMYPSYTEFHDDPVRSRDFEDMETRYPNVVHLKVEEVMTSKVITASPHDPVLKAASAMILRKVRRLPVVEEGELVGIISQGDIHQAIFKAYLSFP